MEVKALLDKAKEQGKGLCSFGVLGTQERQTVETALKTLGVSYETTTVAGEYDLRPYDIYADVNTYR
ncbi:TPA: hypothetical protein PET91_002777 [Staphylococcus aureus]|nr:hypothetical protein [Staphylococcus aureus]HDF7720326.1 hypothetical protein [Staphylococcus aureus]